MQPDAALTAADAASPGGHTQVKSQEESRRLRNVLSRVQTALDSFECLHHQDAGHRGRVQATAASASLSLPVPGGNRVEDKVASLVTLLQSQQDEINSLRKQLESSKGALPSTRPKRELDACAHSAGGVFLDHGRGATLFLQKKRLHVDGVTDDQSEVSMSRTAPALNKANALVRTAGGRAGEESRVLSLALLRSRWLAFFKGCPLWPLEVCLLQWLVSLLDEVCLLSLPQ